MYLGFVDMWDEVGVLKGEDRVGWTGVGEWL